MTAIRDLTALLADLHPILCDLKYVFVAIENARYGQHAELRPLAMFQEAEAMTLIIEQSAADKKGLAYEGNALPSVIGRI